MPGGPIGGVGRPRRARPCRPRRATWHIRPIVAPAVVAQPAAPCRRLGTLAGRSAARTENQRAKRDQRQRPKVGPKMHARLSIGRRVSWLGLFLELRWRGQVVHLRGRRLCRGRTRRTCCAAGRRARSGGYAMNGGEPKKKLGSDASRLDRGAAPPNAESPRGVPGRRPRPADPGRGSLSKPVLHLGIVARRQGVAGVFEIDHAGDELAVDGQLQIVLADVDGDGETALLIGRRVEAVDDFDRRDTLPALRTAGCWSRGAGTRRR